MRETTEKKQKQIHPRSQKGCSKISNISKNIFGPREWAPKFGWRWLSEDSYTRGQKPEDEKSLSWRGKSSKVFQEQNSEYPYFILVEYMIKYFLFILISSYLLTDEQLDMLYVSRDIFWKGPHLAINCIHFIRRINGLLMRESELKAVKTSGQKIRWATVGGWSDFFISHWVTQSQCYEKWTHTLRWNLKSVFLCSYHQGDDGWTVVTEGTLNYQPKSEANMWHILTLFCWVIVTAVTVMSK